MEYLNIPENELLKLGALHTAKEISQQPVVWQQIFDDICSRKAELGEFLNYAFAHSKRIVLTGAGTSAYIGMSLSNSFQRQTGIITQAIASTDIVSNPENHLIPGIPTLIISFARSGNSPESVAVMELADEILDTCFHLIVICNEDGRLAAHKSIHRQYIFALPKEANDESLAMTSSYSGMLLAGLLMARINDIGTLKGCVDTVIRYTKKCLADFSPILQKIAQQDFKRAVFLGSGSFFGTATEAQLKLQELTDGRIICRNETFLGFRHGPKAVMDATTLVFYFMSANELASKYERDLVLAVKKGIHPLVEIGVAENRVQGTDPNSMFIFSENEKITEEEFLTVCYIVPSQILAFYKSLQMGLKPDRPSVNDSITRVVEGVEIYTYKVPSPDKAFV
jgi:tagatose-6-phosphate ketose/aldose isomerase